MKKIIWYAFIYRLYIDYKNKRRLYLNSFLNVYILQPKEDTKPFLREEDEYEGIKQLSAYNNCFIVTVISENIVLRWLMYWIPLLV